MTDMAFVTVKELATRWGRPRATVRWLLVFARQKAALPPGPDQVRRGAHGELFYRADYVALLEASIVRQRGKA